MTPEQFAKATPIIEAIKRVTAARTAAQMAYDAFCAEEKRDLERDPERKATNGFSGGYNIIVATHSDGSGNRIDMSGCYVAKDIYIATMDVLAKKEIELREMLAAV